MKINKVTSDFSASDQVTPGDMQAIAAAGYRSVICNRPDREGGDGQPSFDELQSAASDAGVEMRYIPIVPGKLSEADMAEFADAIEKLPKPVLAFCRTGLRSATLWAINESGRRPVDEIINLAGSAGYDVSGVARRFASGG